MTSAATARLRIASTVLIGVVLGAAVIVTRTTPQHPRPVPRTLEDIILVDDVATSFNSFVATSQPTSMQFGGKINAGTNGCLQNRVIQFWRVTGGSDPDALVTSTTTTGFSQGQFSTASIPKVPGTYYAVAPQQDDILNDDVCLQAVSGTRVVTDLGPP